jgi:hypothetical protein
MLLLLLPGSVLQPTPTTACNLLPLPAHLSPCCTSLQAHHSLSPESVLVNPACQLFWLIAAMAAAELLVILPNPATGLAWSENSDAPYCDLPADADQLWVQTGWLGFRQVV